jgi:hypothetical protein
MNEDVQDVITICKGLWRSVRSNRYFVAFEGGAIAATGNAIVAAFNNNGSLDFSAPAIHKLIGVAIVGGIVAVRMLNRPTPGSNPPSNQ